MSIGSFTLLQGFRTLGRSLVFGGVKPSARDGGLFSMLCADMLFVLVITFVTLQTLLCHGLEGSNNKQRLK